MLVLEEMPADLRLEHAGLVEPLDAFGFRFNLCSWLVPGKR